jgi:hypothetical protein
MAGNAYRLKTGTMAIFSEGDRRSVVLIPANAEVLLVGGHMDYDTFVKIRHRGKVLLMLSEDLRSATGLVADRSRS